MIRIDNIEIQEFRGIKKLQINLKRKNFGVCGPNGTGKSGIVDAIEFGLTGDITRLSGSGSAELSVKAHAPHVDAQINPEKSFVKITTYSPSLNKTITIKRSVKGAASPAITPIDAEVNKVIAQLAAHPEFALSRREIVKYILTPAGQRSKDVQALLQLDQIEKVRQSFQKIANKSKKKLQQAVDDDERAQNDLVKHLGIMSLSKTQVLAAVNDRRSLLQLPLIDNLTTETSLKEGVTTSSDKNATKQRIVRSVSLADIATFNEHMADVESATFSKAWQSALSALEELQKNSEALRDFRQQVLTEQGLALLEEDACPLCDTAWDITALKTHLEQKLAKAIEAAEKLNKLKEALHPITKNLKEIEVSLGKIVITCELDLAPVA